MNWKINYITTGYLIDEQDFVNFCLIMFKKHKGKRTKSKTKQKIVAYFPEEKKILFYLSVYKNLSLFCGVMHVAAVSAQQELSLWHTS